MFGYGVMNLMMTATQLAMQICQHPFAAAATVIQWHVFGMFFPSFFTGTLIARFGVLRIILAGAEIVRAWCRKRVRQYVWISVVTGTLKKKTKKLQEAYSRIRCY